MTSYDYRQLANNLAQAINMATNCVLIESNSVGDQPQYPFATYTITSPYIAITRDITDNECFEVVVSLTFHGDSGLDVLNLASRTNKWFRSFKGQCFLEGNGIIVVSVGATGSRDTFFTVDYERVAGLDIKLRVQDDYVDEIETIDSIVIGDTTIKKNQEE